MFLFKGPRSTLTLLRTVGYMYKFYSSGSFVLRISCEVYSLIIKGAEWKVTVKWLGGGQGMYVLDVDVPPILIPGWKVDEILNAYKY